MRMLNACSKMLQNGHKKVEQVARRKMNNGKHLHSMWGLIRNGRKVVQRNRCGA
jgi:hypothetical protein